MHSDLTLTEDEKNLLAMPISELRQLGLLGRAMEAREKKSKIIAAEKAQEKFSVEEGVRTAPVEQEP